MRKLAVKFGCETERHATCLCDAVHIGAEAHITEWVLGWRFDPMCATRLQRSQSTSPASRDSSMRLTRTIAIALALAGSASPAAALRQGSKPVSPWRIKNLQFMSRAPRPAVTAFGYYVGPFSGTVLSDPTKPTINLFCVDVLNHINWGQKWNGVFTNLGSNNFDATRHGLSAKPQYEKAAYLASMYRNPGVRTSQWGGIQTAVWNLLNPGNPNGGTNPLVNSSEAYWLAQADSWYLGGGTKTFNFSRWSIVTDVNAAGLVQGGGTQEFLTDTVATPEPETWILLGTGVLVVLGVALTKGAIRV